MRYRITFPRRSRTIICLLICGAVALAWPFGVRNVSAHKFHTSISHAEYNPDTKSLEVVSRIFSEDLEVALTKRNHKAVYLDTTKNIGAVVTAYLQDTFEVRGIDRQIKKITWVGMDVKVDTAWVYFEIKVPEGLEQVEMRNRALFELFTDQVNIVDGNSGASKFDFAFISGDEFKSLSAVTEKPSGK